MSRIALALVALSFLPKGEVLGDVNFVRGDANDDGRIDLTDGIFILGFLFTGGPEPTCLDAADADDSGGTAPDITDAIFTLNFLFLGGSPPPSPASGSSGYAEADCGPDPTADRIGCEVFLHCQEQSGCTPEDVQGYLQCLPPWAIFSPPGEDTSPTPAGTPKVTSVTEDVRNIEEDGSVTVIPNVVYTCTSTRYNFQKTPQQIIMFSPDVDVLWPGSLIQGRSYRDSDGRRGSLVGLNIAERAPINVSIPDFPTGANFRTVNTVNQAQVSSAIGEMVSDATKAGQETPSSIDFRMKTYHSEHEFALSFNASGRFLRFEASATGSYDRKASKTIVAVQFYQKMFEVVVAGPATPGGFFTSEFTPAKLKQQIAIGNLGPGNLPVYVSSVVYGRMMMFAMSSTASESEINGTLNAAYKGLTGSKFSLTATEKQKAILRESEFAIASYGGDGQATLNVIKSGDWTEYFTSNPPLSTAKPLSYSFKTLDGHNAGVTEATDYEIQDCRTLDPRLGEFDFLDGQTFASPVTTPYEVVIGDVNGDIGPHPRADLIWNHRDPLRNEVAVGLSSVDGSFEVRDAVTHPIRASEGWGNYSVHAGDFNGDGRTDLIWNYLGTTNRFYVATGTQEGSFKFYEAQQNGTALQGSDSWGAYALLVGDINGDGNADLVWNKLTDAENRLYLGRSRGDGTFDVNQPSQIHFVPCCWALYRPLVADLNGDGRTDLIWNYTATTNNINVGLATTDASKWIQYFPLQQLYVCCWENLPGWAADFNGDGKSDLLWNEDATRTPNNRVWLSRGLGDGTFSTPTTQDVARKGAEKPWTTMVGDVDYDGLSDVIWNSLSLGADSKPINRVVVLRGTSTGTFDVSIPWQTHPTDASWLQAKALMADVNGDGRADIIWVLPGAPTRIYVGLAKPPL